MGDLDNDMDELFRKAANHYPLKTDGADWDKLVGKLPEAVGTPVALTEQQAQKNNRRLLWLILLFPLGWVCNSYFNKKIDVDKKIIAGIVDTSNKKTIVTTPVVANKVETIPNNNTEKAIDNTKSVLQTNAGKENDLKENESGNKPGKLAKQTKTSTINLLDGQEAFFNTRNNPFNSNEKSQALRNASEKEMAQQNSVNELPQSFNPTQPTQNVVHPQSANNAVKPLTDTTTQTNAIAKKDTVQTKNTDTTTSVAKKANKKSIQQSKGFYISAIGGLDASSVKSQGVKKTGYSFGLLVGYKFNKHISVETGLLWDKKQYYTDGQYFDKTRTMIASYITLLEMNGNCNMFELPIDFRYNFAQHNKNVFFGTAGLSSYFMKKEGYDYEAEANGNSWYAMRTYNNSGSNLFSIVNLSVGLEHKLGKIGSLRINPYVKIPLKGLGIGSLPITSSGINIGLTVPFHK